VQHNFFLISMVMMVEVHSMVGYNYYFVIACLILYQGRIEGEGGVLGVPPSMLYRAE